MKRLALCFMIFIIPFVAFSQQATTQMDTFLSATGQIIRFMEYNQPSLKTNKTTYAGGLKVTIRVIDSFGGGKSYFARIQLENDKNTRTASIEYSDLVEILKATDVLMSNSLTDVKVDCDYIENKFATKDGFQIGYYVNNVKKVIWYIQLEKIHSDATVFFSDINEVRSGLANLKDKMDVLMARTE